MNLDQTAEKEKMIEAYHAYLENTAGSKKALKELLSKKNIKTSSTVSKDKSESSSKQNESSEKFEVKADKDDS
jgi:hypothetical protein